jgi:mannose-1-phosphate guanylyltransferase
MPKQFVKLFREKSLFQLTVERNTPVCQHQFIVSNTEQYFLALDQLEDLGRSSNRYLLEPVGRNTAPAIALACFALDPEEIVLITPSDHLIENETAYREAVQQAKELAEENHLVTFGITPTFAETGFGYIEADGFTVKGFHEKPNRATAETYLEAGHYYWNSGMFCFKAGVFLEELKKYAPEIHESASQAYHHANKEVMIRIAYEDMLQIPDNSIDYAVMERSRRVKVIPSDIGWSDVGSFDALAEVLPNDENNNLILSEKVVELIDIEDSIVVDTGDALLVAKKGSSQRVKEVVERLKKEGSALPTVHLTGYRPWGSYTVLEEGSGYKIKHIEVQPGKRLSLQKHYHRNEHWVVLSGSATVTIGEKTFMVNPNESTYIKAGEVHRLENRGKLPLLIIEVQVGEYTGEDDIVRFEDDFRRADHE